MKFALACLIIIGFWTAVILLSGLEDDNQNKENKEEKNES